jgi:hypothetical protein
LQLNLIWINLIWITFIVTFGWVGNWVCHARIVDVFCIWIINWNSVIRKYVYVFSLWNNRKIPLYNLFSEEGFTLRYRYVNCTSGWTLMLWLMQSSKELKSNLHWAHWNSIASKCVQPANKKNIGTKQLL